MHYLLWYAIMFRPKFKIKCKKRKESKKYLKMEKKGNSTKTQEKDGVRKSTIETANS